MRNGMLDRPRHYCEVCSSSFAEKYALDVHRINVHSKEFPYVCDVCGFGVAEKWIFRKHVAEHEKGLKVRKKVCF